MPSGRRQPKISTAEAILIGSGLVVLDAIDLIPIAGDITDIPAALLLFYYRAKHINGVAYGVSLGLDLIPVAQEFPTRTLVWIITVGIDRYAPAEVEQALEKVGEKAEGGAGAAGAGATSAAGAEATAGQAATGAKAGEVGAEATGQSPEKAVGAEGEEVKKQTDAEIRERRTRQEATGAPGEEAPQGQEEGGEEEIEPEALGEERALIGKEGQLEKELLKTPPEPQFPQSAEEENGPQGRNIDSIRRGRSLHREERAREQERERKKNEGSL